jgi:hypothetical protein
LKILSIIRNLVKFLNHWKNGVFFQIGVDRSVFIITRLILLDQEWILLASFRQLFGNLIGRQLQDFRNSSWKYLFFFLGLYLVLDEKIWVRIFVGIGSLFKKKLFFLGVLFRSNRRVTVFEIYQLAIFVLVLKHLVVRSVICWLLWNPYVRSGNI